jgi:hypothetical protein
VTGVHTMPLPPAGRRMRRLGAAAGSMALAASLVVSLASAASASTASGSARAGTTQAAAPLASKSPSPTRSPSPTKTPSKTPAPTKSPSPGKSSSPSPSAASGAATKPVSYQGYTFSVPSTWPVISLAAHPQTCVQFDQHAVYLGMPGQNEQCPADGAGPVTAALLIQPAAATQAVSSVDDPVDQQMTVTEPRIQVTATYGSDRALVLQILASASLPEPVSRAPQPAVVSPAAAGPLAMALNSAAASAAASTNASGSGFDACTAPSSANMRAWMRYSPYHVVGIYIGGPTMVCAQPNLTARWVSAQAADGWSFIPVYAGPQAGSLDHPASQGTAAARAAAADAESLGIKPGAVLYDDMEATSCCNSSVLSYTSAWTAELHLLQYKSGFYSSADSFVETVADDFSNPAFDAPDVIFNARYNGVAGTSDPSIPPGAFAYHARIHQYVGGVTQTYGGWTLNIDEDYCDVVVPYGKAESAATVDSGGTVRVFDRFSNLSIYTTDLPKGRSWSKWTDLGGRWPADPAVVSEPGARVQVFAVGTNGHLNVDALSSGKWSGWKDLGGAVQGTPAAVADGSTVRVLVRGTNDAMYAGSMTTAGRWDGFTALGGTWANDAAAVAETNGNVQAFAVGDTGHLYVDTLSGTRWSGWGDLGGGLQGVPAVVEDHSKTVRVFVRGSDDAMFSKTMRLGQKWSGFTDLGGAWRDNPGALAGSSGYVWVFTTGVSTHLYRGELAPGGKFSGWKSLGGSVTGAPAVVQDTKGVLRIYARGTGGNLEETVSSRGWPTDSRGGRLY